MREPHCVVFVHQHGSVHAANKGCSHPDCIAARSDAKQRFREARRSERVLEESRWVHPDLGPAGSGLPRSHGTQYGRREYGCQCPPCSEVTRS